MTLSEKLDAAILALLVLWILLDRCNVYFRQPKKED